MGRSYNNKAFIIIITKRGRAASVVDKDGFALGKDTMGTWDVLKVKTKICPFFMLFRLKVFLAFHTIKAVTFGMFITLS